MDVFEALYTTRAMRRVKEDPIPEDVIKSILDSAIRAPSGSNRQDWKFVVVTDKDVREKLSDIYKDTWDYYVKSFYNNSEI
jgi:nitroreductase